MWKNLPAFVFLLATSMAATAQVPRMPVEVSATTPDMVGQRFVYFIKQDINSSSTLSLTLNNDLRMQLLIVTLDQDPLRPGNSTAYSVVLTWMNPKQPFPFYLDQYVGYCGSSRVRECAQDIVANTSNEAEQILRLFKAAADQQQ